MKKILLTLGGSAALFVFLFGMNTINKATIINKTNTTSQNSPANKTLKGFALIELFTSEGCSSCPPADELVNKLSKEKKDNVYILAYHVDYWNRLGWKDKFSKAAYSKRQQDYSELLNLNGPYTPQIVVNGKEEFVGSDKTSLYAAINKTTAENNDNSIYIYINATVKNNEISVSYKASKVDNASINFALVELANSSQVKSGENEGRFLQHTNIVTDLKSLPASGNENEISFSKPADKSFIASNYKLVAFLQKKSGEIIAVGESMIK
ncbi:MAG: DUF1223 domain-containing protein [Ferruginibacter sp.]